MNLNHATPQELESYKLTVAGVLKIDPMMLDFIDIPNAQGYGTDKVLYAKRGAAEVLRKNLGVNVLSLEQHLGDGWVTYKATGKDASGRQEIAIGAAYIQDLKGDKVAHAFMTAQTRAVRRLTLQFVTGGVLDESEVQTQAQFTGAPAASAASLVGSPMVVPPPVIVPVAATPSPIVSIPAPKAAVDLTIHDVTPLESAAIEQAAIGIVSGTISPIISPISAEPAVKKPRNRRKKAEGFDDSVQTTIPPGQIDAQGVITPDPTFTPENQVALQAQWQAQQNQLRADASAALAAKSSTPAAAPVPTAPTPAVETVQPAPAQEQVAPLSSDQKAAYTERAKHYYNDVFVKGGMMPAKGIGGLTMKFRKFAQVYSKAETPNLTPEQFEKMFNFLDAFLAQFGPHALVAYVNKEIGATE